MNKGWLRLWSLSLIRSSNPHVTQKKDYLWIFPKLENVFIFYHQDQNLKPSSGNLMWFLQQASTVSNIFLYKSAVCPTPYPGLCSLSPKRSVSICPFPFALCCSHHGQARHVTQGWLTAVCWFNATAYFLCLFVLMSAFSRISGWVRVSLFQGLLLTSGHRHHKAVGLFLACLTNLSWPSQLLYPLERLSAWVYYQCARKCTTMNEILIK